MIKGALIGSGDAKLKEWQENGSYATGAYTMIGYKRLCNIEELIRDVVAKDVPGDVIETGVWKGGACIYMRYLLKQLGSSKKVFAADSFKGLPPPDTNFYPEDTGDGHHEVTHLRVSLAEVKANFAEFGLLDEGVVFIEGWFKDTLPDLPGPFSLIRLDGDMYESTMNSLESLYHKLSVGGYCIIDDWNLAPCQRAVVEFREREAIADEIVCIDGSGIYWQKT